MKKKLLIALCTVILTSACSVSFARVTTNSDLAQAIKLYKAGNYSACYEKVDIAIKKDPSNPLGYYYKAMTAAQIGKKSEAIENYDKTLSLASQRSNIVKYAKKGKRCLETPESCNESVFDDAEDKFIRGNVPSGFSDEARGLFEKLRIEQMMRDMNRQDDINPQRFREYKDFSSMNTPSEVPSNDEIVAAVKTLQSAGLLNFNMNNSYSDISLLTGNTVSNGMTNFANMNPQMIQAMITSGMALGL